MSVKRKVVIEQEEEKESASNLEQEQDVSESDNADKDNSEKEESSDTSENNENDGTTQGNAGWADSIAKILKTNKPKGKKTLVLSKAKKLSAVKTDPSKYVGFEIATESGEIKKENIAGEKVDIEKEAGPLRKKVRNTFYDKM